MHWRMFDALFRKGSTRALFVAAVVCAFVVDAAIAAERSAPVAGLGDYPNRFIELTIPFAPGGGVDLFGRTVASC